MWNTSAPPPQLKPGGIPGCLKIGIILVVLLTVLAIVFVIVAGTLVNNLVGGGPGSGDGAAGTGSDCAFLSDADARTLFGGQADALPLTGIYQASIGLVIDMRVLPDAPDCWVTEGTEAYIARIVRYDGADATARFAQERQNAAPTSEPQGSGITLENEGYFAGEVSGLGDEAFCTGISQAGMAGVLVRQGNRLVYVSVGPATASTLPDYVPTEGGVISSPSLCTFAQKVATALLR
jgi:hypothetical protein